MPCNTFSRSQLQALHQRWLNIRQKLLLPFVSHELDPNPPTAASVHELHGFFDKYSQLCEITQLSEVVSPARLIQRTQVQKPVEEKALLACAFESADVCLRHPPFAFWTGSNFPFRLLSGQTSMGGVFLGLEGHLVVTLSTYRNKNGLPQLMVTSWTSKPTFVAGARRGGAICREL